MLAQTVNQTGATRASHITRALAQMETFFSTPKDPEGFDTFFLEECRSLKEKIRTSVEKKMSELPGPVSLLLKSTCCLSGGAIASLYNGETPKDWDLWARNAEHIVTIQKEIEKKDFSNVVTDDAGSEYEGLKSGLQKGKFVTRNAITLANKIQFILLDDVETARQKFDFIHCKPYYDISDDKLYISKSQFSAIRFKQLIVNNPDTVTKQRIDKFRNRGWNLK